MEVGDRVFIFDQKSDLFIKEAEVIDIQGIEALVMIYEKDCKIKVFIIERFDIGKLHLKKKQRKYA